VLLINAAHQGRSRWQDLINENEDGLLWGELYALADNINELAHGEVGGDQILLLVDSRDIRLFDFLADDRNAIGILLPDADSSHISNSALNSSGEGKLTARPQPYASQRDARP
jgi:hypothetical protein